MKLHRLRYSPYARKVQMVLDLLALPYELREVPYTDRRELARATGGYIYVPVLETDDGKVIVESRAICEYLLAPAAAAARLLPAPLEGPIWAYADYTDGPLEDPLFRLASPAIARGWKDPFERALYVLIKERKFGAGCVDAWERDQAQLLARAQHLLAPTMSTLSRRPFLFGDAPTFADAALYGECLMLEEADPELLVKLNPALPGYCRRVEAAAKK